MYSLIDPLINWGGFFEFNPQRKILSIQFNSMVFYIFVLDTCLLIGVYIIAETAIGLTDRVCIFLERAKFEISWKN